MTLRRLLILVLFSLCCPGTLVLADDPQTRLQEEKAACCCESGEKIRRNPVFENLERVVIHVTIENATSGAMGGAVPKLLQRENIEQTLKEVYSRRFSTEGVPALDKVGCYGRADQPVTVISYEGAKSRTAFEVLADEPGTLAVQFQGVILETDEAFGLKSSILVFDVLNMRNDLKLPASKQLIPPMAVPFDLDQSQSNFIEEYVKRHIR